MNVHTLNKPIAEKLLELYPSKLILGQCRAIIGQFGLTVNWVNGDGSIGEKRYKEGETLSITQIEGEWLVLSEPIHAIKIHSCLFKGFQQSIHK
jgi:hypothetical protein